VGLGRSYNSLTHHKHVGICLGVEDTTVRRHLTEMDSDEVVKLKNSDVRSKDNRKLNNIGENFLTEEGVYALIFRSRKPEAWKYQKWDVKRKNSNVSPMNFRKIHNKKWVVGLKDSGARSKGIQKLHSTKAL
jgi:hypothetical protein